MPPPYLRGWKDTVLVNREAEILVPSTQPATSSRPFMFHCHILEHEDAGMMGQSVHLCLAARGCSASRAGLAGGKGD